jgi:hypothetical protein
MLYGDIQGKGNIYSEEGKVILVKGERMLQSLEGMLFRGWVRYKLGWRTIIFKGYGTFHITTNRVVYLEVPEYIQNIHTFNLDHELGDFGGWDYHAHNLRRAAVLRAHLFFELPLSELVEIKHGKQYSTLIVKDNKSKYKLNIDTAVARTIESMWINDI